ncbi:MAG: DUF5131 family protein [Parcubacteria group bacterium]
MAKSENYWDRQLNVVHGCVKKSEGCDHCWAEALHKRRFTSPFNEVKLLDMKLSDPAAWAKRKVCIVSNLGDLFQPKVPDEFIYAVYGVMALHPKHVFLTLTKYPARRKKLISKLTDSKPLIEHALKYRIRANLTLFPPSLPLDNVWEGTSVESQAVAGKRMSAHSSSGFAKSWLSLEPLLSSLDISLDGIGQVVIGGEMGKEARDCNLDHMLAMAELCERSGVPCFIKQIGSRPVTSNPEAFPDLAIIGGKKRAWEKDGDVYRLKVGGKGNDLVEWPKNLLRYRSLAWR